MSCSFYSLKGTLFSGIEGNALQWLLIIGSVNNDPQAYNHILNKSVNALREFTAIIDQFLELVRTVL